MKEIIMKDEGIYIGTKKFSPAYTRTKFIERGRSFSEEFIHNCLRLIARPNNKSAKHWFNEALTWLDFALTIPISVSDRPITPLFEVVLDEGSTNDKVLWVDDAISTLYILVCKEPYGKFNFDLSSEEAVDLIKLLYDYMLNHRKSRATKVEVHEVLSKWYKMIPNSILNL